MTLVDKIERRYEKLVAIHRNMIPLWSECAKYCSQSVNPDVVDSTAANSVESVATNLMSEFTPYSRPWVQIYDNSNKRLHDIEEKLHKELLRSNFFTAIHQSYLDLAMYGTSNLTVYHNTKNDNDSLFRFHAVSVVKLVCDIDSDGRLDSCFSDAPKQVNNLNVVEGVIKGRHGYESIVFASPTSNDSLTKPELISRKQISFNPFINFRWKCFSGSMYGFSPIMQNLNEIRSYNRLKLLMIEGAALSTSGMWHVDDDGVIDIQNIKLVPGVLISKAVGSKGITPIKTSSSTDISETLMLNLQEKLEKSLTFSSLTSSSARSGRGYVTATEIEKYHDKASEHIESLYCRLQNELVIPLVYKALHIMRSQGVINHNIRNLVVRHTSNIGVDRQKRKVNNVLAVIQKVCDLDSGVVSKVDTVEILRWVLDQNNLPSNIIKR